MHLSCVFPWERVLHVESIPRSGLLGATGSSWQNVGDDTWAWELLVLRELRLHCVGPLNWVNLQGLQCLTERARVPF